MNVLSIFLLALQLATPTQLKLSYDVFNEQYFGNKLPKDVVIDYGQAGNMMAQTSRWPDGRFHIAMNEQYTAAERVAHLVLLHEQCHIKEWTELTKGQEHGPRWRTCMLTLEIEGAFRNELIDGGDYGPAHISWTVQDTHRSHKAMVQH